jgi:O-acetyl-ADP-ribose deacetylase (regulator of RNase III)
MTVSVEAVRGDITVQSVDAIVNAANSTLLGGAGVDGAIHAAAGPSLLEACRAVRRSTLPQGLPVGEAVATGAGRLHCSWVIHTVGPNWHRGERDPRLLASCFARSLSVASQLGARSIAFPAISAGAYGWEMGAVADVAVSTVLTWPGLADFAVVRFVLFSQAGHHTFDRALAAQWGTTDGGAPPTSSRT